MRLIRAAAAADDTHGIAPRFRRQLTRDLDAIVRKALAKAPTNRYRSMDAMISDLEAFLAKRPVGAHAAGPLYFAWRFVQRRRYAVAASVLALLALASAALVTFRESRVAAEHAERAAREAEVRAVTREMLTDLLRVGPASGTTEKPHSTLQALDEGAEQTLRALGSDAKHRAIATAVLAQSYLDTQHPQRARELIRREMPSLSTLDDLDLLDLELASARASAELGEIDTSKRSLATAEATMARLDVPAISTERLAAALIRIGIERHSGERQKARQAATDLLREFDRPEVNESLEFADLLRQSAYMTVDDDTGSALYARAREISAKRYGAESPVALNDTRHMIIRDLNGSRKFDSVRLLEEQETRVREAFGEQSIDYADLLTIRCESAYFSPNYQASVECWTKVLSIYEQEPDAEPLIAAACDNIADGYVKLGEPAKALPYYERELAIRSKTFAASDPNVIHSRLQIAKTRCLTGDADRATRDWDDAIDDYVRSVGPSHPWEAVYAAYFATCLLDAGRTESARSIMERHGKLDPPRKDMTAEDRADVAAVWARLTEPTSRRR
jgi:eukaryotic-like serine/threonine-protein kinase